MRVDEFSLVTTLTDYSSVRVINLSPNNQWRLSQVL